MLLMRENFYKYSTIGGLGTLGEIGLGELAAGRGGSVIWRPSNPLEVP